MHQVVTAQLAARRSGTQSTKTRAEVRGGGAQAVQAEGHRQRPPGLHPRPALQRRWRRPRPEAAQLQPADPEEDDPARAALGAVRPGRRGQGRRRRLLGLRRSEDEGRQEAAERPRRRRQGARRGRHRRHQHHQELPQPARGAAASRPASSTPTTCCAATTSSSRTATLPGGGDVAARAGEEGRRQEGRAKKARRQSRKRSSADDVTSIAGSVKADGDEAPRATRSRATPRRCSTTCPDRLLQPHRPEYWFASAEAPRQPASSSAEPTCHDEDGDES